MVGIETWTAMNSAPGRYRLLARWRPWAHQATPEPMLSIPVRAAVRCSQCGQRRGQQCGQEFAHGAGPPPEECMSARNTVTSVSQRVIGLRGSSARTTQASAAYQGSDQGATTIQAKQSANGTVTMAGWSGENRR